MKRLIVKSIVLSVFMGLFFGPASNASPVSTEDPFDPCFQANSGQLTRNISRSSGDGSSSNSTWLQTNVLVRKSDQIFRAQLYTGSIQREVVKNYVGEEYSISYDSNGNTKTVSQIRTSYDYFSEYIFEEIIGWLLDDTGNNLSRTSITVRSATSGFDRYESVFSTQTIARNCSGQGAERQPTRIFDFSISPEQGGELTVPAYSRSSKSNVKIVVEPGSVASDSKLMVVNDPYSTENEHGFASLGFALVDPSGKPATLNKPILVKFERNPSGQLAFSTDAKMWDWIDSNKSGGYVTLDPEFDSGSLNIKKLHSNGWLFVGQKIEQMTPVLYASSFKAGIGEATLFTTTGGSGKGGVILKSLTPQVCEADEAKRVVGLSAGDCKVIATKHGFDGYVDSESQLIRIQVLG